ncbi:universal stress protein [Halorientalis litorea]|jgi:nucleotide-binding universal stress UspA family protein|uniref:universal stress protein n=1 Tax=Halorientalis litorea TaxID=2931977 RepID=UPI001FF5F13D|nr:universal stress protein [Halorientalis litorea]
MTGVAIDRVLVSLDGGEAALDAAEFAVAIAARYDAAVHALYVLEESVARSLEAGELDDDAVAARTQEFMDDVDRLASDHDVPLNHSTALGFSESRLSHHPGNVVLDTADAVGADFLVVPREPVTGAPEAVLGKAAEYVLMYASQPVLSV